MLRLPALRFAPPRLDHLPHDRAAFLGRGASPSRSLRLPSSSLASAPAEGDSSRILPFRHARDSSIGARSYVPVDLRSPLNVLGSCPHNLTRRSDMDGVKDLAAVIGFHHNQLRTAKSESRA